MTFIPDVRDISVELAYADIKAKAAVASIPLRYTESVEGYRLFHIEEPILYYSLLYKAGFVPSAGDAVAMAAAITDWEATGKPKADRPPSLNTRLHTADVSLEGEGIYGTALPGVPTAFDFQMVKTCQFTGAIGYADVTAVLGDHFAVQVVERITFWGAVPIWCWRLGSKSGTSSQDNRW